MEHDTNSNLISIPWHNFNSHRQA